jgi:hypothetical protein
MPIVYITLLGDGTGGGWAFGPSQWAMPPQVQADGLPYITLPLCDPAVVDALVVGRSTVTLDAATTATFAAESLPPQSEQRQPAVLLVSVPEHHLAVAIGTFPDTYAAQVWWGRARTRLKLPGMSAGVYALIEAPTVVTVR